MGNDWQDLQQVFHAASVLNVEERAAYLARACVDNEELRVKVEALIEASEQRADFLEHPAFSLGLQVLATDATEGMTGQLIGAFKILRLLGRGGMGNVYLAEDTQLGRKVALKFLSGKFAHDQWAKRQFTKEAQAVAMLDHPNICPVYRFEEANGYSFIVMQYVEGERLDQLIQTREVGLSQSLSLAIRIARALAKAHAHGIIHRDIKPSNIMVSADGELKVLDFGLAKIVQQQQGGLIAEAPLSNSLQLGFIPGTIAYMSPEQLRDQRLDYRTDIFSFGVVLYEMVSGRNPFARDNNTETIPTIPVSQPQSAKPNGPRIARELNRVVQKCLKTERSERYQSASELLAELEMLQRLVDGDRRRRPAYPNVRVATAITLFLLLVTVATFVYGVLTRTRTVAVLPIANETGDTSLDYLSDGLTENVINKLSGLSKLRVKPFSTVSGYKGQQLDPRQIGQALKADAVVVGKLRRAEGGLSLHVVMIDSGDGTRLWGDIYPIGLAELFRVEDNISQQLTSKLELWPRRDEARIMGARRARTPEAYEQYMFGRYYWRFRTKKNINQAIDHFQEAIRLDPLYAQAYAGLADSYVLLNTVHYGHMDTKEAMAKAEAAAREALLLDDTLPEAHTSLGIIYLRRYWDWAAAEKEFKKAIELNYNFAPAHFWYSNLLPITNRPREAIAESAVAKELDPFSPVAHLNYCRAFYYAHDYDNAAACFARLVKEQPDYDNGRYLQGLVFLCQGMYQEATRIFEHLYAADKTMAGAALGYTYGVTGRQDKALKVLAEMKALQSDESYISAQEFAIIYTGLGDKENAFVWLQKAADEHFGPLAYIEVNPLFDSLRVDIRFASLTRSLNLPARPPE